MGNEEIEKYLAEQTLFSGLTPDQLAILARNATPVQVHKGEMLFRQGDDALEFYIVRDGEITVQIPAIFGPPLTVQTLTDNSVLGWSWLIAPYKWTFEARATRDSMLLKFDGRRIIRECENYPAFGYSLIKQFAGLMSERLHYSRQKMMDNWAAPGSA